MSRNHVNLILDQAAKLVALGPERAPPGRLFLLWWAMATSATTSSTATIDRVVVEGRRVHRRIQARRRTRRVWPRRVALP